MSVIGLDMSVLTGWYNSRINASLASSTALSSAGASSRNQAPTAPAPWEVGSPNLMTLEEMSRKVLANGVFFNDPDREFSGLDAPDDHKQLFSLHQGLKRLASLAEEAKEKTTTDSRRDFLDKSFQSGLAQFDSFFDDMDLEGLTLLKGEELTKVESEVAIARGTSQYKTDTIHKGDFDAEVASLTGDVQFSISVKKSGVTQTINIDLADMGATTRNLDNISDHINTQLEAAGVITRFERTKIGEKNDVGVVPGDNYGFLIAGVSTETVSFSASAAEPALYFAGVSGINDSAGGQVVKLTDLASGDPQTDYSTRFSADPNETEVAVVGGEEGETRIKQEDNPLEIHATVASNDGGIFVVGHTTASTDGQTLKGEQDLVLAKYDSTGNRVWSRVLGAAESAQGLSIATDSSGNVVVAGKVEGGLGDSTQIGGSDSIVVKYSASGVEQWNQRFGGTKDDQAGTVAIGDDGTVYVAGKSASAFGDDAHEGGGTDGYIRAIDASGTTLWTRRVGSTGEENVSAIAIAEDGNLVVASEEDGRAVLRKFDVSDDTSAAIWEQDFGDLADGRIGGLAIDASGIYVTGAAGSSFAPTAPVSAHAGGVRDAFVMKLTDGGTPTTDFLTFVGSDKDDAAAGIQVHNGKIYIAGKTLGGINGDTLNGERDAFAAQLDGTTGALDWSTQISGRGGLADAKGIALSTTDDSVLDALGLPTGTLTYSDSRVVTDRSSAREDDFFYISVDGGRRKKITIDADDTMRSLTFKINATLVLKGTADVRRSTEGDMLRIKAAEGSTIELFAGSEGRDLLKSLGISPGAIVNNGSLLDKDDKTTDAPPLFALDLPTSMSLKEMDSAEKAMEAIQDALSKIQRAYRDLTMDPALKDLLNGPQAGKTGGTVPAYYNSQLANYQAGLDRLNSGSSSGGLYF
ncbi:outer membrane protein assembly factor BamB [Maricaulis maris]|uniref:Outer membrane protein assembly factor BamB n=2 Tax=Maricaulis maris TaxID=74318 RepID=A0A495DD24_9PROT|nr:outer membrane protein assembly factor BamB [Maricaulis maris]